VLNEVQEHPAPEEDNTEMASIETPSSLKEEGTAALKAKDYDTAIEKYTDALDLQPTGILRLQILSNRSYAYNLSGDYTNGMCDANKLIDLDPKYKRSYLRLAQSLYGNDEINAAVKACDDGLNELPNNNDLLKFRAKITGRTNGTGSSGAATTTASNLQRYSWYIRVFIIIHFVMYPVMAASSFFRIMLGSLILNMLVIYAHHGAPQDAQAYAQKCVQNVTTRSSMQTTMYALIFLFSRPFFIALMPVLIIEGWYV
jgi:tetratricopeptide (TPR) repeat protein